MMTEIAVTVLDAELFADELDGVVDSTENEGLACVHTSLAGTDGIVVVPPHTSSTANWVTSETKCVVVLDTILCENRSETRAEVAKIEILVRDWIRNVPSVGVD